MRGDLVEEAAADVCRELAAQGASGILAIDGPGGPGRVVFVDGRIIAAVSPTPRARLGDRLVGAGELDPDDLTNALAAQREEGETLPLGSLLVERGLVRRDAVRVFVQEQVLDALFEIIRWRYGAFRFVQDVDGQDHGVPLSLSVDDALVEVARRQQEWNELSQVIPDLDSVPSFRVGAATASASLEPDEFAVLASVDGVRSVRALAADLGYGEFEAARIVYGLNLLGIVDVHLPQDEIGAALEDALGLADFEEEPAEHPAGEDEGAEHHPSAPAADPAMLEPEVWEAAPAEGEDENAGDGAPAPTEADHEPLVASGTSEGTVLDAVLDLPTDEPPPDPAPLTTPAEDAPPPPPTASDEVSEHTDADQRDDEGDWPELISAAEDAGADVEDEDGAGEGADADMTAPDADVAASEADERVAEDPDAPPSGIPEGSTAQRGDDNDVSEFLRELSRLSVDGPSPPSGPRPPARPSPPPPSPSTSESDGTKKKRRGLFGRG